MTDWVKVDSKALRLTSEDTQLRAIRIRVSLSPYDVPTDVRGHYDDSRDKFVIEFKYIQGNEDTLARQHGPIVFDVGKQSGRLYSMHVDVRAVGANAVSLELKKALETPLPSLTDHPEQFRIAGSVIEQNRDQLFASAGLQ